MQSDLDKADLSARVTELGLAVERLQKQNLEKDQVNKDITEKLEALAILCFVESRVQLSVSKCPPVRACGGSRASGPRPHRGAPSQAEVVHPAEAPLPSLLRLLQARPNPLRPAQVPAAGPGQVQALDPA
ncbi:rootletin-like isoform X1 [Trachypithecus francoisi]|uniref:rootletin-like isoform X1 n=1 Tax=Trachypithecus francoisi TaxID=54180 RepID=UPI00141B62C7|nr:rootletin-like isoform X1 [Trachypithecus francoisi]XP_033084161.1 rootletin-like isoform X1 [Trachypithecus francoisi]